MWSCALRTVTIELGRIEALVLFEFLHRLDEDEADQRSIDPPERLALWRLEAALERTLDEPLRPDYHQLLERARGELHREAGG